MVFGQVVIGPPGSGKSTYCEGMRQYLEAAGRSVSVVNLDPANDLLPYEPAADIRELVSVEGAASACGLGPNGALVYCLEYLEANLDWLEGALSRAGSASYVLLDLPGQVELYTHYPVVRNVLQGLQRRGHRLCCVHLAHHCSDAEKFLSVLLVTLSTMVQLEMPQVNLLSKLDLVEAWRIQHVGPLPFNLDFYTDVLEPARKRRGLEGFAARHLKLSAAICELVEDFGLVGFGAVAVDDSETMARALRSIDKANGYCFGATEGAPAGVFGCAAADLDGGRREQEKETATVREL
ncbi:hypothetical protein EMIHUDRAFT_74692 [Emiliania huxleyi CCMP1516]|uniref:GPN-loop GTPase 2 n=2 Tax=Emiliania huxleyi TaxID=2903 RepID=A0A0D3JEX4_EMIH1|nr:hypothetical protein EMIHUDRAFT_74692 [Emiliania huxleyi CCMP1516]EOD22059.1 hypothetical protein EMIHUDRAFT_74692 [Emiliania huxleyi CCMP1516]|eukprot:XP_005774488.1 hypothetical protein EMIHUDRAFT_74692 [Emiliania huxleyi CCMP1516]